jgi:hypothetical protein
MNAPFTRCMPDEARSDMQVRQNRPFRSTACCHGASGARLVLILSNVRSDVTPAQIALTHRRAAERWR